MNGITGFNPEVCEELEYYVYRLVDPRNGQTFMWAKEKITVFLHISKRLGKELILLIKRNFNVAYGRNITI